MWGKKKAVEEPVEVDEVFDDLHAELDDIVVAAEQPEAEVPEDFEARVNELTVLLREAQERARQAKAAVKPEGLSPFKTPFESKPAAVVERSRSLNRRITRVEVEAGESRIVSQFEDNEPEEKKVYPAVWNLGYRLEELAEAVSNILIDSETGDIAHKHDEYALEDHSHDPQDLTHSHDNYFLKGSGVDDNGDALPLPYNDAFTLGEAVNEVKDENGEQNDRLDDLEAHGHTDYISAVKDTLIKPTADNPFITINTKVPKKEDGSFIDGDFGLEIDLDEGNTWHNQFNVGTERNGYALKVLGGTGRNVWFGGEVSQKGGGIRENAQADNFIVRKNLTDEIEPLWEAVDQTKDDVEALEAEMELLAKTLESGTWKVTDSSIRPGQVNLNSNDFSAADNILTIHDEDNNGKTHGWTTLAAGEYIELTADHTARNLADADYALYEVTSVMDGGDFVSVTVKLYQGHGDAVDGELFRIKVIDLAGTDISNLDERYATKNHTHSVGSHSHSNYAAATHSHSGEGGFTPDRDWDQYTHQIYDGSLIHRQTSYTYPRNAGDWTAQKENGNNALSTTATGSIYQLGIHPLYGTGGFQGGYTGLIAFGEDKWSEVPIVLFQVIKLERSTDYFRWYVRQVWTCNPNLQTKDLDGKSFMALQGAVYK